MLISTSITVAYKCSSCGGFEFFDTSLFELVSGKKYHVVCRCNNSSLDINKEVSEIYKIKTDCINCGNIHEFKLSKKDIIRGKLSVLSCPETGMLQCVIGKGDEVRGEIDTLEKQLDDLIDMFGYESYFNNTRVMYDSLNRIHDIAEKGNLICECGNKDIELSLLSDRILMKCKKCLTAVFVRAASNKDLRELSAVRKIFLTKHKNHSKNIETNTLRIKSDGK